MPQLSVVVITSDEDQKALLQVQVDGTAIARMTHCFTSYPQVEGDSVIRRIQDLKTDIVLIDVAAKDRSAAVRAIEVLRSACPGTGIFAVGDMGQAQLIVESMRAGAQEFLPRPATTDYLLDAFNRFVASRHKHHSSGKRGRVFVVLNAKGGNGATTVAVNTAVSLALSSGSTALIDMAPLGNAALHLNLKTGFSILDALNNLHRLDPTLLDGFMTRHQTGLHLLAGHPGINMLNTAPSDYARLFDTVVTQYRHVVVDASTRLDSMARAVCDLSDTVLLVANPELASLWSAVRIREFLSGSPAEQKLRLVLNRYRKMAGYPDSEIEATTQLKILCKIPNNYATVIGAIEKGMPVAQQNHSDTARCFVDFSKLLASGEEAVRAKHWVFRTA
jgi:pilus assembly protein CpaE